MNYFKLLWELRSLKHNTKKTHLEIQKMQREKVYQILHYAYDHSDYYRTKFLQAGIAKMTIDNTPISEFPTIDKQEFMNHFDELVTVDDMKQHDLRSFDEEKDLKGTFSDKYHVVHSSGSSGQPCYFIYDDHAWNYMLLGILRGALWDMSMWDILKLLWKTPRIVYIAATDGRYGGAMAVGSGIEGVHAKQLSLDIKQPLNEWIEQIEKFAPNLVIGYSSAIKILAEQVDAGKVQVQIERIITCGEPLNASLRAYLKQVFHCDVVNFYGASESLALGVEIHAEEGMYLFDDMNYIEVENGTMYLTSLYNYAQPLIRYELSDRLIWDTSDARYPFSKIKNLAGRKEDLMWFQNEQGVKEFLHPLAIEGFCMEHMLDYQFIQSDDHTFQLHIEVAKEEYKDNIEKEMTSSLKAILKEKKLDYVTFEVTFVHAILPDPQTGKKQLIVVEKEGRV